MERSREQSPPPTTSYDLMARFDMAHDRKDRPPEVRSYLENLRPQILKLQRELRLVTQEDIDGLDRRDDLEMNDVDKLVGLIEAFKKAWRENKVAPSAIERMEDEIAFRDAGQAFGELEAVVSAVLDNSRPLVGSPSAVIRAMALAGEPRLAWKYFEAAKKKRVANGERIFIPDTEKLPIYIALWDGFVRRGETPPFDWRTINEVNLNSGFDNLMDAEMDRMVLDLVRIGLEDATPREALAICGHFRTRAARLRGYLMIRDSGSFVASSRITEFRKSMATYPPIEQIECLSVLGEMGSAMRVVSEPSKDPRVRLALVELYASRDRAEQAFELLNSIENPTEQYEAAGKAAAAFLRAGDGKNALRAIRERKPWYSLIGSSEVLPIVLGLMDIGEDELAHTIVERYGTWEVEAADMGRPGALVKIACAFADRGMDASGVIRAVDQCANLGQHSMRHWFRIAAIEARAGVALRTLKRAARRFGRSGTFDRDAWEEKMGESITRKDLAELLTYDEPIE